MNLGVFFLFQAFAFGGSISVSVKAIESSQNLSHFSLGLGLANLRDRYGHWIEHFCDEFLPFEYVSKEILLTLKKLAENSDETALEDFLQSDTLALYCSGFLYSETLPNTQKIQNLSITFQSIFRGLENYNSGLECGPEGVKFVVKTLRKIPDRGHCIMGLFMDRICDQGILSSGSKEFCTPSTNQFE